MKTQIFAISALGAFFTSGLCAAGSFEDHFGGQEGVNAHFQGTDHRLEDRIDHLQRSDTNNNAWDARQQAQIDNNTAWNDRQEGALRGMQGDIKANAEWDDRQEGVIRQNRGRLDENDALNQRQNDSIDNAHARIGGVKQQVDENSQSIGFLSEAHTITNRNVNANASAITATQARVEDVKKASADRDARLGRRIDQREQHDVAQDANSGRIESESIQRDTVIAGRVDYNEQVNAAYRRQSVAQFEQHGAAIESNRQAIASEREARKQQGREANAGIASAAAIGQHHFDTNYQGFQLSVSGAGYRGEHAQSLSAGGALTDSVFGSIAVSHDSRGNQAYGANATFKF